MSRRLFAIVFIPLAALLLLVAGFSLRWPMFVDSPILVYVGYLMVDHGLLPYRDIFDMNTPGVHLFNFLLVTTLGQGRLAFRVADLACLAAVAAATWAFMRRLGRQAAVSAAVLFGLAYLAHGPYFSLQREFLLLVPVSLSVLAAAAPGSLRLPWRSFLAGLGVGAAATIKPHAAIVLPVMLLYLGVRRDPEGTEAPPGRRRRIALLLLAAACGFALPLLGVLLFLAATGSLGPFLEIARNYWPLYTRLSTSHQTIGGIDRLVYLIRGFSRFGGPGALWFVPAALGLSVSLHAGGPDGEKKRLVLLLAGCAVAFALFPVFAGQFWEYHYLPLTYFLILLGSASFAPLAPGSTTGPKTFALSVLLLVALFRAHPPLEFLTQITSGDLYDPRLEKAEEIAGYLKPRLAPGDTVQPLDWTGGAVHGMLRSEATLATRFLYDFHFYHHVSSPYIRALRGRFISEFDAAQPRFVVEIESDKPWVWGHDTTREFPELRRRLMARYRKALQGTGYAIYERK